MIRRFALAAVLLLTGPLAAAESAGRTDGRITMAPVPDGWRAVGRLNVAGYRARRHCTATLVAPDTVLTAWHCLSRFFRDGVVEPGKVHFLPGYDRGDYLDHLRGAAFRRVGREAVLITLQRPSSIPPIAVSDRQPHEGDALFQAGYSGDRGHVLTADPSCRHLGPWRDGYWRHDCEAIGGDSGAPILHDTPDGLRVVAIHIGRLSDGGSGIAEPVSGVR